LTTGKAGLAAAPRNRRRYFIEEFTPGATLYHGKSPAKGGEFEGRKRR